MSARPMPGFGLLSSVDRESRREISPKIQNGYSLQRCMPDCFYLSAKGLVYGSRGFPLNLPPWSPSSSKSPCMTTAAHHVAANTVQKSLTWLTTAIRHSLAFTHWCKACNGLWHTENTKNFIFMLRFTYARCLSGSNTPHAAWHMIRARLCCCDQHKSVMTPEGIALPS